MKINNIFVGLYGLAMVAGAVMVNSEMASARVACDGGQPTFVIVNVPNGGQQQTVEINRKHIFCGEVSGGRAKGFHSRPGGQDPITVNTDGADIVQHRVEIDDEEVPTGLYNLRDFDIIHNDEPYRKALSTMFPDDCSYNNVLTAIANASNVQNHLSGATCQTAQGQACGRQGGGGQGRG